MSLWHSCSHWYGRHFQVPHDLLKLRDVPHKEVGPVLLLHRLRDNHHLLTAGGLNVDVELQLACTRKGTITSEL